MATLFKLSPSTLLAALAGATALCAGAQSVPTAAQLDAVTVHARSAPALDADSAAVGGFASALAKTPQSISVIGSDVLAGTAAQSLAQVLKLDASLADSYNTVGYFESLSVRGFVLDSNSNNFRRDGLASSNYTALALENIERIEVLKGVAGLQAGVAAPGGLVNYVSKQPLAQAFSSLQMAGDGTGGNKIHLDVNAHTGALGWRLNLASEQLQSHFDHSAGERQFASLALAHALSAQTTLSAQLSYQRKSQPSVPGLGLLDSNADGLAETLPPITAAKLNLNNQSWSLPVQTNSVNTSLALEQRINANWRARLAWHSMRSQINDRVAFPDGCSSAANYVYPGLCANGDVDIYDYRSDAEQRRLSSWQARLDGRFQAAGLTHSASLGLEGQRSRADLADLQAYNWVGTSNIFNPVPLPSDATLSVLNSNSIGHTLEAFATLNSMLSARVQTFVGLRSSQIARTSARSDGSEQVALAQTLSTPWAALTWSPSVESMVYASWGEAAELEVVPNRPGDFVNYGAVLTALKSQQNEMGLKWQIRPRLLFSAALFDIRKPYADDQSGPAGTAPLRVAGAKRAEHRGLEWTLQGQVSPALALQLSAMWLDARYTQAIDPALIGQRVTNVPRVKTRLFANYKIDAVAGLACNALLSFTGEKSVTPDGAVVLPSAWQLDAGVHYQSRLLGTAALWRLNLENLTDRAYWREAPSTAWAGIYLFPATPRTLRASLTLDF